MPIKVLSPDDLADICDAAAASWRLASGRAMQVSFAWRGELYKSDLTMFQMHVCNALGEHVVSRYL